MYKELRRAQMRSQAAFRFNKFGFGILNVPPLPPQGLAA